MRMTIGLGLAAALLAPLPAAAMVPVPLQRRANLHAVIDLPVLATLGPIDRIEWIAPDLWRVTAGRCHVDVRMLAVYTGRSGLTGPHYEPRPGRRICTR
jgi:hypothetical protein